MPSSGNFAPAATGATANVPWPEHYKYDRLEDNKSVVELGRLGKHPTLEALVEKNTEKDPIAYKERNDERTYTSESLGYKYSR